MELIVLLAVILFIVYRLNRRSGSSDVGTGMGPVGWVPGSNWRVLRPLSRADLRRVLFHPAFLVGVLLTPLMLLPATEYATTWRIASGGIALALVPLGWLTIIATNLVTLRPRRTGADELFAALPAPQPVRTSAMLFTAIGPVAAATALAAGWVLFLGNGYGIRGDALRGTPDWTEIGAGVAIVAGSVCVGVAVARWLRHAGFGVLAAFATILIQARFLDVTTWPWSRQEGDPFRFLAFIADDANTGAEFLEVRPAGWHLLYLGALVLLMAGVALAREGLRPPIVAGLGAALLVTAGAGWMQTRPLSIAQESQMVASLTDPVRHQVCNESDGVRYCAYDEFAADISEWQKVVKSTTALLPPPVASRPLAVLQRPVQVIGDDDCTPMSFEASLPPGVADRVSPAAMWPADGQVHPGFSEETFPCSDRDVHGFFLAVQTGAWATGLPSAAHHDFVRCRASGQARAAIALWAGAAASRDGESTLRDVIAEGSGRGALSFAGWDGPPAWGVRYAVADAELALAMLDLPVDDVRDELERDWVRWTDPSTASANLGRALALDGGTAPVMTAENCP